MFTRVVAKSFRSGPALGGLLRGWFRPCDAVFSRHYRILLVHWQTCFSMWVVSGAQPRRPADWRQERVPADLTFSLGQELGTSALETVMR